MCGHRDAQTLRGKVAYLTLELVTRVGRSPLTSLSGFREWSRRLSADLTHILSVPTKQYDFPSVVLSLNPAGRIARGLV